MNWQNQLIAKNKTNNKMKKLLLILLCVSFILSCGEKNNDENKVTIGSCDITEDLWINEQYISKDTIGEHISSLYDGIKFLKNGGINHYMCAQPFINKKSDTIIAVVFIVINTILINGLSDKIYL